MLNIALIICTKEDVSRHLGNKLIRKIFKGIILESRKKEFIEGVRDIQLFEGIMLYLFDIPFSLREMGIIRDGMKSSSKNEIEMIISQMCKDRGIQSCIIPAGVYNSCGMVKFTESPYSGRFLFKSLLTGILDELYSNRGIRVGGLDTLIIRGEDDSELYSIIRQISPLVKYINIFSEKRNEFLNNIDDIFGDYGLAIGITEDLSTAFKHADIIINLRNSFENIKKLRAEQNAVIINYASKEIGKCFDSGNLINGIEVGLPKKTFSWVDSTIQTYFSNSQIAEIALSHKTQLHDKIIFGIIDDVAADILSREFASEGFKITGFTSRYGIVKTGEINCLKTKK